MNHYFPSPFTVWLVHGCVAIPTAIQPGGRTGLELWRCGHPRPSKKKFLLSVAPSLLSSLRTSLSLPGREAASLCERAQRGRKKRNCPSSSADPRGLSAEDATAYEESEAHWRLILNRQFNPSYTELPPAVPSLWGTFGTERHQWHLSMFCLPHAGTASH